APFATFRLWRRMKLWELRSYDEVIRVEQERLVYRARLRARYGRAWRRKAPVESLMPLKLARYGVPMEQTAAVGLAAAGIDLPAPAPAALPAPEAVRSPVPAPTPAPAPEPVPPAPAPAPEPVRVQIQEQDQAQAPYQGQGQVFEPVPTSAPEPEPAPEPYQAPAPATEPLTAPVGAGNRRRVLADGNGVIPTPRAEYAPEPEPDLYPEPEPEPVTEDTSREEIYDRAFRAYHQQFGNFPNARQFGLILQDRYGISSPNGGPLSESTLRPYVRELRRRLELDGQYAS
ncbi:hypothetical protein AB0F62_39710, partial [Streptomyces sp. NPDC026673]